MVGQPRPDPIRNGWQKWWPAAQVELEISELTQPQIFPGWFLLEEGNDYTPSPSFLKIASETLQSFGIMQTYILCHMQSSCIFH